jgi:hypothetical protein
MTFKSDTFKKSLISKASPVDIHKNLQSPEYINTALLGIYIEHVAIVIYIDDTWHAHTHTHNMGNPNIQVNQTNMLVDVLAFHHYK